MKNIRKNTLLISLIIGFGIANAIECEHVKIPRGDIYLAADIYLPAHFNKEEKYPAIVVSHPGGGVKEQVSGLYAKDLAEKGFVTVAFDAAYQGKSGGEIRGIDSPFIRAEDIGYVVDYLDRLPYINDNEIGALGICAGGGATVYEASIDHRIKAAATVSLFDVGEANRDGKTPEQINEILRQVAMQKEKEARGDSVLYVPIIPDTKEEIPADAPVFLKEAVDYYRTPRAYYPTATNRSTFTSTADAIRFYPFENLYLMDRPLLIISGDKSDTLKYSEAAYEADKGPKELYLIKGATHVDMYDKEPYVSEAVNKLSEFFHLNLQDK